jgi:hypothetical protein
LSASSTIVIVTSSSLRTRIRIFETSRRPSPLGEKCWGEALDRRDLGGALEALGDEEGRERRGHEEHEDDARGEAHQAVG